MDITWESPPPAKTGLANKGQKRSKHWKVLEVLEQNPGQWALIDPAAASGVSPVYGLARRNNLPFESVSRRNPDGTYSIYARRKEDNAKEEE